MLSQFLARTRWASYFKDSQISIALCSSLDLFLLFVSLPLFLLFSLCLSLAFAFFLVPFLILFFFLSFFFLTISLQGESISAISGQLGFVTLESRGDQSANLTLKDFTTALTQLTGEEQVELGKSEFVSDGILVDVPQALADKALAALKVGKTSNISLSATTELPQDLLGNRKQYQGFASGGGGRAGGSGRSAFSSRGRGDSQGGRGSFRERSERPSFGGDRRGGRGGFGEDRPRRNYEDRGSLRRLDGDRRASSSSYGSSSGGREYKARREGSRESNFDPNSSH